MEIRPLRETDSRLEVSRIYEESWKFAYQGIVPQSYLDGIPAGRWADVLDRAGWDTLVLTEGGKLAGTSSVCPSRWPGWPGFGEVASLYLLPEYMGRGYGLNRLILFYNTSSSRDAYDSVADVLLEAAGETLAGQGFRDVLLWVLEDNRRARRFYERAGFAFHGDAMEDVIGGKPLREVLYLRHIE